MRNPWLDLPEKGSFAPEKDCFVLECDKQRVSELHKTPKEEHKIHLEVLPEPYTGNPEAPIVLLNLNPRFGERNKKFLLGDEYFYHSSRANLIHAKQEYPFYLLDPKNKLSPGYYWYSRKLKPLIDLFMTKQGNKSKSQVEPDSEALKKVANEVFVVEFFPYHTVKFSNKMHVPSQAYSYLFVKEALKRNALIILMRGKETWEKAIPELRSHCDYLVEDHPNYFELRNYQNPTISQNNCRGGFREIRKLFESKYGPLAQ